MCDGGYFHHRAADITTTFFKININAPKTHPSPDTPHIVVINAAETGACLLMTFCLDIALFIQIKGYGGKVKTGNISGGSMCEGKGQ